MATHKGGADKGWACKCGVAHNYASRSNCRWCGERCPSRRIHNNLGNWFPRYYKHRNYWHGGYQPDQSGAGEGTSANQEQGSASTDNPIDKHKMARLKRDIAQLAGMDNSQRWVAEKQEELRALERKILESKPKSQILQRLEQQLKSAENKHKQSQEKVTKQQSLLEQTQRDLEQAQQAELKAKEDYDKLYEEYEGKKTDPGADEMEDEEEVQDCTNIESKLKAIDFLQQIAEGDDFGEDDKAVIEQATSLCNRKVQEKKQMQEKARKETADKAAAAKTAAAQSVLESKGARGHQARVSTHSQGTQPPTGAPASSTPISERRRSRSRSPTNLEQIAEAKKEAAAEAAKKTTEDLRSSYAEWLARKPADSPEELQEWEKECPMVKKPRTVGEGL